MTANRYEAITPDNSDDEHDGCCDLGADAFGSGSSHQSDSYDGDSEADLRASVDSELHDRSVNSELHRMSGEENCQLTKPAPDVTCPQACPRATPGGITGDPPCFDEWIRNSIPTHPITPPEELWPIMYQILLENWTAKHQDSVCA